MSYDRALTVFSPDGHLFQVEYAMEVVKKGTSVVGILGSDCVVLAAERKSVDKLQDAGTLKKIYKLDASIYASFSGLSADARILMGKAQVECASYRLNMEDAISTELIARYIAGIQQKYTQKGGARPFGISTLICGIDAGAVPCLYLTDPSGIHSAWKAYAIGKGAKVALDYLEKAYPMETAASSTAATNSTLSTEQCLLLATKTLLEVLQSGLASSIELVMLTAAGLRNIPQAEIELLVAQVNREKAEAEAEKKQRSTMEIA